jgi:hypothetical protein
MDPFVPPVLIELNSNWAAEVSDSFGKSVGPRAFLFGGFLEFTDRFNISLSQLIDGGS